MGHERVGALPKTKEWRRIVEGIGAATGAPEVLHDIATATLLQVRQRFDRIAADSGFQAAFRFILGLATDARLPDPEGTYPRLDLASNQSAIRLTSELRSWVDAQAASLEYAEIGKRAAADAIAFWITTRSRQRDFFGSERVASEVWAEARNAGAFSDLSRVFFGKFTERYLRYFLDREASAQLPDLAARERFASGLTQHIEVLAQHSFEATKITQSFAAGWYNNHARASRPTSEAVYGFLSFAMGKLRQELLRESSWQ
jgi:hypothetical protein